MVLLGKLLLRVIISNVFGQYADRRLINAPLDPPSVPTNCKAQELGLPIWPRP